MKKLLFFTVLLLVWSCRRDESTSDAFVNWAHYQGGPDVNQYSPMDQINTENVGQLEVAWTFSSGDKDPNDRSQIQCNPLVIDGILYGSTPQLKIFALDAATGEEKWLFDPFDGGYNQFGMGVNRGLCYWTDGGEERILFTAGPYLYALDAQTGTPFAGFGEEGKVDLHDGLGRDVSELFINSNSPGVIYKDLLIQGTRVSEAMGAAPGHIRAYNVRSGAIEWIFHTIPQPGEFGHDTWPEGAHREMGGANAWSGMSIDQERGIVFVPTGSASYDFYGGDRPGKNLFANCLIALNAATGERIWHFQTVHHDIWDRDLPAPPNLVTVEHKGRRIDAVAQITKSAFVFLFDRETGEPLFPIEEVPVAPSKLEGEQAWPTQPIPAKPPPFSRQRMEEPDITRRTDTAYQYVKSIWETTLKGDPFIPPSEEGTIIIPGFDGGGEWGGAAVDPDGIMYINASNMAWILQMVKYEPVESNLKAARGKNLYISSCLLCHGKDLQGASIHTIPSLVGIKERKTAAEITEIVTKGKGMMPSFAHLKEEDVESLIAFLFDSREEVERDHHDAGHTRNEWKYPYVMTGYQRFVDRDGFPAVNYPWGTLNAIDLNEGEIKWQVTLGHHPDIDPAEGPTGTECYGGPVVTAGNLIFIAATLDEKFRAFDKSDGRLLWETDLPAGGYATPAVYGIRGKQYVVVAAGGGKMGTKSGDTYVAYKLPD